MDYYHSLMLLCRDYYVNILPNNKLKLGNKCAHSKN